MSMLIKLCKNQAVQLILDGTQDVIASNIATAVNEYLCNIFGDEPKIEQDLDNQKVYVYPTLSQYPDKETAPVFIIHLMMESELVDGHIVHFDLYLSKPIENYLTSKFI